MAGITLATAYYELVPSMAGAQGAITKAIVPSATSAGAAAGRSMGSSILGSVGSAIQAGSTAVVGAAATGLGVALTKGLGRLTAIDTATAKLKGLGNSASNVTEIMSDALASVKGTAFGLGDAATVAAQAVAAGITPGTQLTTTLKTVANSAAAAGTDLNSMGSIFAQVAASGKAYNGQLQQLSDRGIPIYQTLAKQLNTTADGVFNLASAGKISFAQFQTAAQTASGSVAAAMGTTLTGALDNLGASLGRIGANLMSGFFPNLAPTIQAITNALAGVETRATTIGQKIGGVINPALQKFTGLLQNGISGLSGMGSVIAPVAAALGALGAGGLSDLITKIPILGSGLGNAFAALGGPIGIITAALGGLIATSPQLQAALGGVFASLAPQIAAVAYDLQDAFSQIGPVLSQLASTAGTVIGQLLQAVTPIIGSLLTVISNLLPVLAPVVAQLGTAFVGALTSVLPAVTSVVAVIGSLVQMLLPVLLPVITNLVGSFAPLVATLIGQLAPALGTIASIFTGVLAAAISALLPVVSQLLTAMGPILTAVFSALMPVINALLPVIVQLAQLFGQAFLQALTALMPAIQMLMGFILQLVPVLLPLLSAVLQLLAPLGSLIAVGLQLAVAVLTPLIGLFTTLLPPILGIVNVVIGALLPIITDLLQVLQGLINFLTGVFTGNWKLAFQGLGQIASGFLKAIGDTIGGIGAIFGKVPGLIGDALSGAGSWLVSTGEDIVRGLLKGIGNLANTIGSWFLSKIPGWIVDPFKSALGIHSPSTVFQGFGDNVVQGLINGITGRQSDVAGVMSQLVGAPTGSLLTSASAVGTGSAFPSTVTLVDSNDSILGHMDVRIDAFDSSSSRIINNRVRTAY